MGGITEVATAFRGNTGQRPNSIALPAEMLRLSGYSTASFSKSHETAAWNQRACLDRLIVGPTRSGFDKFYVFLAARPTKWSPTFRRHDAGRTAA